MPSYSGIILSTLTATAVSYLIYFDYRRRNDAVFRRQIKRSARKHKKEQELMAQAEQSVKKSQIEDMLRNSLRDEKLPENLEEREKFFVEEIARADELINAGESQQIAAALAFYRALRVYPNPVDLLTIYDKSLKQPVLDILRTMIVIEPPPAIVSALGSVAASMAPGATSDFSVE